MDFNKLGKLAQYATLQALHVIQNAQRNGRFTVWQEDNPYVRGGKSATTGVDVLSQRVYTNLFATETPEIGIKAEEKDPLLENTYKPGKAVWVIDGVDGTNQLIAKAPSGYGTQCALLQSNGTVPIAFVGDATTGEVFGYHGNSGVFRIDKHGKRSLMKNVVRKLSLSQHSGLRRPTIDLYHPLSRRDCRVRQGMSVSLAGVLVRPWPFCLPTKLDCLPYAHTTKGHGTPFPLTHFVPKQAWYL